MIVMTLARLGPFAFLALTALMLAACGSAPGSNDTKVHVLASSYPFAYVAEQVAGDYAAVDNLTKPGIEPHDLELRPKQVAQIQEADLLIFSTGFQPAIDDAKKQSGLPAKSLIDVANLAPALDSANDHKHLDPHSWLNPLNQAKLAHAIARKLSVTDPDHAADYQKNAANLADRLTALDALYTRTLATCQTRSIVTGHAAFAYLAHRYDLHQIPIAGLNPSSEPSPAQLAKVADVVRKEKISTIFTEALASPAIAKTVATETGARLDTLDPIEGLSDKTAGQDYLTLMHQNLRAIAKANNCS